MSIRRNILALFVSLRTALLLLVALIFFLVAGSLIMPAREAFLGLHTVALFPWMREAPIGISWWLWSSLAVLSLLAANTLVCSLDAVIRKRGSRQWLLVLSPQIMHAGFLLILLAHLLSAYGSMRAVTFAYRDTVLPLPDGVEVKFVDVRAVADAEGYVRDWSADVEYYQAGMLLGTDRILPNRPSFRSGIGIYIKTVKTEPFPVALVEASREPGAPWALAGGILFLIGMVTLLALKIRGEGGGDQDSGVVLSGS